MSMLIAQDREADALRRGTRRFLLFGLLAVVAVIVAILVRQGLFRQTATLSFVTGSAQDISKGQAVRIAGFRVGSVVAVTLRPDGQVEVAMEIDADQMRFVTRDAVVELRKEALIGAATLEIVQGPDRSKLAADQARLAFSRGESLTVMASQLREQITPILKDVKTITGILADAQQGLPATLKQMRDTTGALHTLLDTGNRQVTGVGTAATRVLVKAEEDLTHVGRTLETTNNRLPALLDRTQKVVDHVEKITAEAETSVPPLLRDGAAVAGDAREIMAGARTAWPIRNLVDAPAPARLKADSDPRAEGTHGTTR
jgi:phospholipid/cholesterol/gamma-HCH transport system substrate-binding protein